MSERLRNAQAAIQRRDWRTAEALLAFATPEELTISALLDRALAQRMLSRLEEALLTLEQVLVREPANFLALLSIGALLERLGRPVHAATAYRNALAVAPPTHQLPVGLQTQVVKAAAVVRVQSEALARHLRGCLADLRGTLAGEPLGRFDESLEILAGVSKPYVQQPLLFHYPRLPAIPFYDRALFPWLEDLESATPMIQEELAVARSASPRDFVPYIDFPPGVPVNQWETLNHSRLWSTFFLWRDGIRLNDACALCPRTTALLEALPMARQPVYAPTAMFSALEGRTVIPPHTGSANTRLVVHLPLVVPGPARFRVGAETRPWRMGQAWVFDDTIEHEAWNDADDTRIILIFDVWNPFLSDAERALISAMMSARNDFQTRERP